MMVVVLAPLAGTFTLTASADVPSGSADDEHPPSTDIANAAIHPQTDLMTCISTSWKASLSNTRANILIARSPSVSL
jgi:hypothetical protein